MIDQRRLPAVLEVVSLRDHASVAAAIRDMVVRGAPAIGAAAAFGLALAARESLAASPEVLYADLESAAAVLKASRPTAVNLSWAVDRVLRRAASDRGRLASSAGAVGLIREAVLDEAQAIADEDVAANRRLAEFGASLIRDGDTIIHHCNTGALATVDWGTALGVIRMAAQQGKKIHVLVGETRPRLQGSRLSAWELEQYGVPYDIIADSAAGRFLQSGEVNLVLFGADRVAANGDVVNKVGTYMLALAARDNHVPAYAAVPTSTIDHSASSGASVTIEERPAAEVLDLRVGGERIAPATATARNPGFDVTPARLVTSIITELGIILPPYATNLRRLRRDAAMRPLRQT